MSKKYSFELKSGVLGGRQGDTTEEVGGSGLEKGCLLGFSVAEESSGKDWQGLSTV